MSEASECQTLRAHLAYLRMSEAPRPSRPPTGRRVDPTEMAVPQENLTPSTSNWPTTPTSRYRPHWRRRQQRRGRPPHESVALLRGVHGKRLTREIINVPGRLAGHAHTLEVHIHPSHVDEPLMRGLPGAANSSLLPRGRRCAGAKTTGPSAGSSAAPIRFD